MALSQLMTQSFRLADAPGYLQAAADGLVWPKSEGRRLGAWSVTVGALNRALLLWMPANIVSSPAPGPVAAVPLVSQYVDVLEEVKSFAPQGDRAKLYELRTYTLYAAAAEKFVQRLKDILPVRERFSPNVGVWRSASGDTNRVFHMWAYADMAHRDALRPAINAEPLWQEYVAAITPLIADMRSMLLQPLIVSDKSP